MSPGDAASPDPSALVLPPRNELLERRENELRALRRVAGLVARGAEPSAVFAAVTDEMRQSLDQLATGLWRFESTGEITLLAGAADPALRAKWSIGTRTPVEGNTLASEVWRAGLPARMDAYGAIEGSIAAHVRLVGVREAIGVPVVVDGRVWGLAAVGSTTPAPMPADTESRMHDFAELVATATAIAGGGPR